MSRMDPLDMLHALAWVEASYQEGLARDEDFDTRETREDYAEVNRWGLNALAYAPCPLCGKDFMAVHLKELSWWEPADVENEP
jgi:hypothetical protein